MSDHIWTLVVDPITFEPKRHCSHCGVVEVLHPIENDIQFEPQISDELIEEVGRILKEEDDNENYDNAMSGI